MEKGELRERSAAETGGSVGGAGDERSNRIKELGNRLNRVREEKEELRRRLNELDKDEAFLLGELGDIEAAVRRDLEDIHIALGAAALPSWDSDVYY